MKKSLIVLALLVCSLMLFGCGEKKTENTTNTESNESNNTPVEKILVCTKKTTTAAVPFVTRMDYHFLDDKITKLEVEYTYDLSSYTDEQRKGFASADLCSLDDITKTLGMNDCQERLSGTDYIVSGTALKLQSQVFGSIDLNKSSLETDGWSCIIK